MALPTLLFTLRLLSALLLGALVGLERNGRNAHKCSGGSRDSACGWPTAGRSSRDGRPLRADDPALFPDTCDRQVTNSEYPRTVNEKPICGKS
jgi:hypothetical protein